MTIPAFQPTPNALNLSKSPLTNAITRREVSRSPVSRRIAMTSNDLLVIGAGTLGSRIGKQWRNKHPNATIRGETRTEARHGQLRDNGFTDAVLVDNSQGTFNHVVYAVPPSGAKDLVTDIEKATKRVSTGGRFVLISSTSVHGQPQSVTERTEHGTSERLSKLQNAEKAVLQCAEGAVLRCAGLYLLNRGPQSYYTRIGQVKGSDASTVNLVHYDDAAAAAVCLLSIDQLPKHRQFLASAKISNTKRDILDSWFQHPGRLEGQMPTFLDDDDVLTKSYDSSWTRNVLGWKPKYESFVAYIQQDANRVRKEM